MKKDARLEAVGSKQECRCEYPAVLCEACESVAVPPACLLCGAVERLTYIDIGRWNCADLAGCMARRRSQSE